MTVGSTTHEAYGHGKKQKTPKKKSARKLYQMNK